MTTPSYDAVVVGAGFSGLYLLHKLRQAGFTAIGLEAADDVGGTWYWNRYPGARCDVASVDYSYSFSEELQQEWEWTERYATQPEILRYLQHVAARFDLKRDIRFSTRVAEAVYDEARALWMLRAEDGYAVHARFCIMATGVLSTSRMPDLPGLSDFAGPVLHTGRWPREGVDFSGRTVAVIGTGSSGIQVIPEIARQARQLTVFQRTPNFSLPAGNRPLDAGAVAELKAGYPAYRAQMRGTRSGAAYEYATDSLFSVSPEQREAEFERRWKMGGANFMHAYTDIAIREDANTITADFVRRKITQTVKNPETARKLTPTTYPIGTKRICLDTNYFETFNRDNVSLVDLNEEPLQAITRGGVRTATREYAADALVCATGFDAMTGALLAVDIRTRAGASLRKAWKDGPRNYLGLMVAGFPNLFTMTGPGSPSVLSNMVMSIEQHVEWIVDCLEHLRRRGLSSIEATTDAQDAWVDHVRAVADQTLYPRAASWYMGANVPGKPRVFLPYISGVGTYRQKCEDVVNDGYRGFVLRQHADAAA